MPSAHSRQVGHESGADPSLYAIDFSEVACGKAIAATKRRLRWRFGFANPDALAAGLTGEACRGEEHDVTLVWSVTSGKRLVMADTREVHFSHGHGSVFEHTWTLAGANAVELRMVAYASTAFMEAKPGLRQFDLFIDGRSFFRFPKVYRMGLTGAPKAPVTKTAAPARRNLGEEVGYLRESVKFATEPEPKQEKEEKPPENPSRRLSVEATDLLIDFLTDYDTTGNTLPPAVSPASSGNDWASTAAPAQANTASYDPFAPTAPPPASAPPQAPMAVDPFAPQPSAAPPGAMVTANGQGGNWGLQQQPPAYTMTGGYGQGQPNQQQPQTGGYNQ